MYCEYLAQQSVSGGFTDREPEKLRANNVAEAQHGDEINIHKEQKQHMC